MISNFLQSGQVGNIATGKQAEARKAIQERWDAMGFTKGLSGYLKENMAVLFENEANQILNEATDSTNSGSFETVVFPLVRRVFSRLLANDIVSVQAMNMPIGKLFFIMPVTSERKWEGDFENPDGATGSHYGLMGYERVERNHRDENGNYDGARRNRYYLPDEVVNVDESGMTPEVVHFMKKSLYDLFYNDFLYDQSKGKIHIRVGEIEPAFIGPQGDWHTQSDPHNHQDLKLRLAQDGSIRNVIVAVKGFSSFRASKLTGPDGNEMDTEAFLASLKVVAKKPISVSESAETEFSCYQAYEPVLFRVVTQRYGKGMVEYGNPCDAEGKIYLELDLAKPTKKPHMTMDGYIGVDPQSISLDGIKDQFMVVWSQYDSLELETEIGEVSFKLSDVTVSVEERKLRATWSPELAQDVAAFHNIDAEAELTAILSEQIAAEIDREILRDLRKASPWQLRWDYNGWRRQGGFSTNYTQKDWNQTFMTKINQISAQIHKSTLRGGANFVVVSTEISAMLNDLEYFHVTDANAEAVNYSMGIEKVGSLQGRYQVYVDPYSPAESCIIGHKGDSLLDTGYIYAPYVPMQLTPTIYNSANFAPVKGIITRYAKKMVNNRYYGAIVCNGLQTWDINELR
jgi:hypothetical protein